MIAAWSAHAAFIEPAKNPCQRCRFSGCEVSVTYWWNNQIADQCISFCYCSFDTAWVCARGDVQLRSD
jgi:hypothetical protein